MAKAKSRESEEEDRLEFLKETDEDWELLGSVLLGMYEEIEKLTKKTPVDEISDLALRRINQAIKMTKEILAGDPFVDSIESFVATGENPEYRDVLMILRDLRQGLSRQRDERQTARRSYKWDD